MSAEKAICAILTAASGVSSLVGNRIYPVRPKQSGALPAITYFRVDGPRVHSLQGPSGLGHPRIQIDCYASTYADCLELSKQVRLALDGYRGIIAGVNVQAILLLSDFDMEEDEDAPIVPDEFRRVMDFRVWYQE